MRLTDKERQQIADGTVERVDGALLRTPRQWAEILAGLSPTEAAARVLGDIRCFTADRGNERRNGALADVIQLARAMAAWATIQPQETV